MTLFPDNEAEEITRNINIIIATPKGFCPLNRDLGLDAVFLDMPTNKAKAAMRSEIVEQIEKYEPRAKVKSITFEADALDGVIKPRITLEFKNV